MRKKTITLDVYKGIKTGLKTSSVSEQTIMTGYSYQTIHRVKKSKNFNDYKSILKAEHQKYSKPVHDSIYYIKEQDMPKRSMWDKLKSLFS